MDFRHRTIRTAVGLALANPMAVFAQNQPVPAPAGAGKTLAHCQQHGEQKLMAADPDGDGRFSRAGFVAAEAGHGDPAARFARLDTNGDGISSAEARAAMHRPRPDGGKDDAPRAAPSV